MKTQITLHSLSQHLATLLKKIAVSLVNLFRKNPHIGPSLLLFTLGIIFLATEKLSIVSGALFGAGASLLGAWISDFNSRKKEIESKRQKDIDAVRYLTPELIRTIERVLYIHERSLVNYSANAMEYHKSGLPGLPLNENIHDTVNLGDQKEDFIPHLPVLYPNSPQFRDLNGDKAVKLVRYYDSLIELEMNTKDWWKRKGQLPSNIFIVINHLSEKSLKLALDCLTYLKIEEGISDTSHSDSLCNKILSAFDKSKKTRENCYADFEKAKAKKNTPS